MCNTTTLVPIPPHLADYREYVVNHPQIDLRTSPEFGYDRRRRVCFRIDTCIVPALLAVWKAGFRTLGCCCGHGTASGGIITIDTMHGKPTTYTQKLFDEVHRKLTAAEMKHTRRS